MFFKLYAIRASYFETDPVKRALVMKLIEVGYFNNRDIATIEPREVIKFQEYNDPYNYTEHTNYMNDYMGLNIRNRLGLSFLEYISMDMPDFVRANKLCELMKLNQPREDENVDGELAKYKELLENEY